MGYPSGGVAARLASHHSGRKKTARPGLSCRCKVSAPRSACIFRRRRGDEWSKRATGDCRPCHDCAGELSLRVERACRRHHLALLRDGECGPHHGIQKLAVLQLNDACARRRARMWTHSASVPGHKQLDTRRRRQPVCILLDKQISSCLYLQRTLKCHTITNLARAALLQVSVEGYTFHVVLCAIPCAALIRAAGRDGLVVFALTARRHCIRVTARQSVVSESTS